MQRDNKDNDALGGAARDVIKNLLAQVYDEFCLSQDTCAQYDLPSPEDRSLSEEFEYKSGELNGANYFRLQQAHASTCHAIGDDSSDQ